MALKKMKKDIAASRVSVELTSHLIFFGLSQGLQFEDGTYSSTLLNILTALCGAGGGYNIQRNMETIRDNAPFSMSDLKQIVKDLRRYSTLMWDMAQKDGRLDYAMQYSEVVRTLIYGIYFIWEKYKYENGWIDSIAEEGEDMLQYQMFQVGVVERIQGLLNACRSQNLFDVFPRGQETNEMLILIYSDLLSNIKKGAISLDKYNKQFF